MAGLRTVDGTDRHILFDSHLWLTSVPRPDECDGVTWQRMRGSSLIGHHDAWHVHAKCGRIRVTTNEFLLRLLLNVEFYDFEDGRLLL